MANIMIVDDSPIIRRSLTRILEQLGHQVVMEAVDGRDAVEKFKERPVDLITMDIHLPGMNGIEAVRHIRQISSSVIIIMITSVEQKNMVYDALKLGARHYIVKPFTDEKVKEVFESVIGLTPLQEAAQQRKQQIVAETREKAAEERKKREPLKLEAPALMAMPFEIGVKDGRVVMIMQRHVNLTNLAHFHACLQGMLYLRSTKFVFDLWEPINDEEGLRLLLDFITTVRNRKGTVGVVVNDLAAFNVLKSKLTTGVYRKYEEIDW
ncbi:response regulator [Paenibacillus koleovorans]|uniref:response regulator n=1 Tax=Paenibacillus koleovorans TaxID=121608 RepID=UPI000FD732DA|nr:response regulator [Paenibacillus koleovorans]